MTHAVNTDFSSTN